ncbi:UNVERIFIED_CONTAM: Tuberculostearic acid methyltransferase UfaA1 [Sesamum calycinum]|uniref:Tuberculostearic acid methyltransferase UfaA1 n=1 Tax=Sesamum calycinum TaxID=2727403 RepID=A0AAW2IQY5_9LAMI
MPIKRVAVVGGGVSGLATAYILAKDGAEVVVYEKDDTLGGHAKTVIVDGTSLDLGFMVFNCDIFTLRKIGAAASLTTVFVYPDTMELFENLGVDRELSDLSFSVSLDEGQGCEWGTRNGLSSLFAQKTNVLNPYFWNMIREIIKFKDDASAYVDELENNPDIDRNETLEHFIRSRGYSELFQKAFLIPTCASIWSCTSGVMSFSAYSMLSFLRNNPTLQRVGCPQRLTPRWHSQSYVNRVKKELESRCCQIRMNSEVYSVLTNDEGCAVTCRDGSEEVFDGCIIATQARDALKMLGKQATHDELRILGAFQYAHSDIFLHRDNNLMPKKPAVWSSRNFLGTMDKKTYVTYWLNDIQLVQGDSNSSTNECAEDWWSGLPFFLTLNPPRTPKSTLFKWSTSHPIPSVAASKASHELNIIQGNRRLWFCGAYQGYGFPEDGVKLATEADFGFPDAYINGDFSFVDKNEGLLNFFLSNELFSLFLDETMTYSCAIFQSRISKEHHVLEIGCGWGSLALEVVKRTGCRYTGITLSEKQLQYAEQKVKEAGQQFTSVADEKYDEFRLSPGFIKEYIFPGGCLPSLSSTTSAMAAASRLSVVHLEEIGCHYFHTLRRWRENLLRNQRKLVALGFDEAFVRKWEYYFDNVAAGFKYCILGDYQIVFCRPGDVAAFGNKPYNATPGDH